MATTGIGSGLCGGNVLAMAIEGPGGTDRRRALCQVGQEDKQGRGQGVQRQLLVGYSDRVTITHSTNETVMLSITSTALRYVHPLNK